MLRISFFLIFLFFTLESYSQQTGWTLVKQTDKVKVYQRASKDANAKKELRLTTEINASLSSLVSLFADKASYPKWVYGCASAKVLKQVSELEINHIQTTDMPWPVQNRDLVVNTVISQNPETKVVKVSAKGIPDYAPVNSDYIRVKNYTSCWTLTPKANGVVEMEYILSVDPGGSLPDWLVNMVAADGPVNTVKNIRSYISNYKDSKLAYIKEF